MPSSQSARVSWPGCLRLGLFCRPRWREGKQIRCFPKPAASTTGDGRSGKYSPARRCFMEAFENGMKDRLTRDTQSRCPWCTSKDLRWRPCSFMSLKVLYNPALSRQRPRVRVPSSPPFIPKELHRFPFFRRSTLFSVTQVTPRVSTQSAIQYWQ